MQPNQAVFLLVLIWASCCPAGSKALSDNFDLNHELATAEKIAQNVGECLSEATQNITEMLRTLPPDINERAMELIEPYLINVMKSLGSSSFFPLNILSSIPPEMLLKCESALASMGSKFGDMFDQISDRIKGIIESYTSDLEGKSSGLGGLIRMRRDTTSWISPMFNEFYDTISQLIRRATGLPIDAFNEIAADGFDVTCKAGMGMYNSLSSSKTQIDCDNYATMLRDDPREFFMTFMSYVLNDMAGVVMDAMTRAAEMVWSFAKTTLIPMLYNTLNQLKDSGELPSSLASMVSTFDLVYNALQMFGIL